MRLTSIMRFGVGSFWGAALVGWLCLVRLAAAPSFTAEITPPAVGAGDAALLRLIFTDLGDVTPPTQPSLTNATVRYQGVSQQFSIVNFSRSSSIIHQYILVPQSPGVVSIPALEVQVDGKTYTSQPLTLQVGQGFDQGAIGFLRLITPRPEVYVGETFPVEIRFYYRESPARQAPPSLKLDGFTKGREVVENLPPETLTNVVYSVVRWKLALTAVKAGDLTLGPAEFQTIYILQTPNQRRPRGLNSLFEPLFSGGEQRQLTFQSQPVALRVLNPPAAGRPPQFTGAVGRFNVEATASPTNVAAGDPITVKVQITGQGNFDGVHLPELPAGSGFQLYPGTNSFTESDALGLSGTKTFEAVIIPESPGVQTLKWPWVTFWDPLAKTYRTDQPRSLVFNVRPGAQVQAQPVGTVPGPPEPRSVPASVSPTSQLPLLPDLGPMIALTPSPVTTSWYWGALALPLFAYAVLLMGPVWARRRAEDPARVARDQARRELNTQKRAMHSAADQGDGPAFFAALNAALQQQLALVVGGTPGAFTGDVVAKRLVPVGFPPEMASRLEKLFDRLEETRFSPATSVGELPYWREEADTVIHALQQLPEVGT